MSNYFKYNIPYLNLSDSSSAVFHNCERKLELRKFYGHAKNEEEDSLPPSVGKALHSGYQTYFLTKDREQAIWAFMERYPWHIDPSYMNPRSPEACLSTLEAMINSPIHSRYKLAYIKVNGEELPAIEVPFRIIFKDTSIAFDKNINVYWDGYIDIILYDTLEEKFIVVDIKTTRKSRNDYTCMFSRDEQCLPYAFVIEKALGQPANHLDCIYLVAYIDALEPRVLSYSFIKTREHIQAWAFGVMNDIKAMKQMANLGIFPKRGKSCDTYGPCEYNEVCDYADPKAIREWLRLNYGSMDWDKKEKEFNPWFTVYLTVEL